MKGGDDMKSNLNVWAIVGIVAVVGLIAGIVGASITGNVIRSYDYKFAPNQVYTKQEVDNIMKNGTTNQGVLNMLSKCKIMGVSASGSMGTCKAYCESNNAVALNTFFVMSYYYYGDNSTKRKDLFSFTWIDANQNLSDLDIGPPNNIFGSDAISAGNIYGCNCCPKNGESFTSNGAVKTGLTGELFP